MTGYEHTVLTKQCIYIILKYVKKCFTSVILKKIQVKTTMRYQSHYTGQNSYHQKKSTNNKVLEGTWRKENSLALLVGMQIDTTTMKNSIKTP